MHFSNPRRNLLVTATALLSLAPLTVFAQATPRTPADLVLRNGRIMTVDSSGPQAQALAVRGSRIVAIGTNAQINRLVGKNTRVIDLTGKLAVPGLIEGHGHFMGLGEAKMKLDLTQAKSWNDIVAMVRNVSRDVAKDSW
ncbi:MAG: amidohydrolase family protein, partial [Longimicrobiales bacterium]